LPQAATTRAGGFASPCPYPPCGDKSGRCTILSVAAGVNGTHVPYVRHDNTKKKKESKAMEYPSLSETVNKAIANTGLKAIVLKDRQGVEQAVAVSRGPQTILVFEDVGNPTALIGLRLFPGIGMPDRTDPACYIPLIASGPLTVAEDDSDTAAVWQGILNLFAVH